LARSAATHVLSVRHHNRPGVLAHVFRVLYDGRINVEEVENIAYHGAEAACARIHISGPPSDAALLEIRQGNPNVISVDLSSL
jgi:D-3-phosphoglycerate dehydrogenase